MIFQFTLSNLFNCTARAILLAVVAYALGSNQLNGQEASSSESMPSESVASIGLGGKVRLGKWSPVFIQYKGSGSPTKFEIDVLDGDDTPLVFTGKLRPTAQPGNFQAWIRLGRKYGNVSIRLLDNDDQLIEELIYPIRGEGNVGQAFKSTNRVIATLEPDDTFKSALETNSGISGGKNVAAISALNSGMEMPLHWLGYESAQALILVTSDIERIEKFSPTHIAAIKTWVENGGRLVVSVAKNGERLIGNGGKLESFAPGTYSGLGSSRNTNLLESYADSDEQLIPKRGEPISISEFDDVNGEVVVADNKRTPLVVRSPLGLGEVVFVTFDLDNTRITNWAGFNNLVARLVSSSTVSSKDQLDQANKGTSVATYGYDDLVGQLRVPLDAFSNVRFVTFTWIAILIGLYILCIGPGDFFFLKRLLGKMELTWITFPLLALIFCGLAFGISKMTRPSSIQLNQLELIDIDTVGNRARGSVWSNLYSPHGGSCSIEFDSKHNLGFELESDLLSWHGLPGDGLGGMWSGSTPGLLKTGYEQLVKFDDDQSVDSSLVDLPLQVSSTKPMYGQWWAENPLNIRSNLDSKSGRLSGTFKNPFDFRLKNCRVLYGIWAYELKGPLEANDPFDLLTGTKEKTLEGELRRKFKKSEDSNRSRNTVWDPTDTNINRIALMMMFYKAAGGINYTGLTHNYQSSVDMTDNLLPNRAILIGEIDKPGVEMLIDGQRATEKYDQTVTLVRILLPVEVK